MYDGTRLAARGIVVVSINYRLGAPCRALLPSNVEAGPNASEFPDGCSGLGFSHGFHR
jgi:hypothetical protein